MPTVIVEIEPAILDWAITRANGDIVEKLLKWKNGERMPTFNQIESISKAMHLPLGYFFLKTPPVEDFPLLEYRTVDSLSTTELSRDAIDTINQMERVQEWMRDYMIDSGYERLPFVGLMSSSYDEQAIAEQFFKSFDIATDWHSQISGRFNAFKFFRKRFEDAGILVMVNGVVGNNTHRSLSIKEFRAFTLVDDYAPLIFVNGNDSQGAKLFSLIHEAVHIFLGKDNLYNDRYGNAKGVGAVEALCNKVTAEILVPTESFICEWNNLTKHDLDEKFQLLAKRFNCGTVVVARRAFDNRYITRKQYQEAVDFANQMFMNRNKNSEGGNFYNTVAARIDRRLILALDNSTKEGKTQYTDAYRLTNTTRKTFSKLLDEVRGV